MALNMISNMSGIKAKYSPGRIIEALEKFQKAHEQEYKDALEVYQADVVKKTRELFEKASSSTFDKFDVEYNLGLTAPVNCDKEYGQLINLFKMTNDDEIELDFGEANRIFNNEWEWALAASVSNTFYSSRKR